MRTEFWTLSNPRISNSLTDSMGNISAALASPGNSNFKERCEEAYKLVDNFINDKSVDSFKYGSEYEFDKDRRKRTQKAVLKSLEVLEGIFQRQR